MKTAMQELIEEMKANAVAGEMFWIKQPNEFFEKYLEKEKQQIADAFRNGSTSSMLGGGHWTQYYNQTYNQEETLEEWKSKFTYHCAIKTNQNK